MCIREIKKFRRVQVLVVPDNSCVIVFLYAHLDSLYSSSILTCVPVD
uniref:Uncharacterized protein n=1 Tax=Arundo donax TaxID=35708 RepID=A0A0A9FS94_ARUDO